MTLRNLFLSVGLLLSWGMGPSPAREWQEVRYKGRTTYTVQSDSSGRWMHAESRGQNSALIHSLRLNPRGVVLAWRWRALRHPAGADPTIRDRDDRAAAVIVLVRRSMFPWRTHGLLYQWSPAQARGTWAPSPFAPDIHVLTLENGPANGLWRKERRDLEADLRAAFGELPPRIEAIGVMCDTDNTSERASADFGPIAVTTTPDLGPR